jgi:hypothetical protein
VQAAPVGDAVDGHRRDVPGVARPENPARDLAAVRDQHLVVERSTTAAKAAAADADAYPSASDAT